MLTSLIIRALRPVLVPMFVEALEIHARAQTPTQNVLYVNGYPATFRQSPMQGSP